MKVTIERSALLKALSHVQSVVEKRNTIPILSNILMTGFEGQLSLTATDMDMEVVESVEANVVLPGSLTAPAHTLHDIVRKLPDGAQVELDSGGDATMLTLKAGRSRFKLGCLPTEDFPRMAEVAFDRDFALAVTALRTMIERTRFAISTEETRYYLNGIYVHAPEATDKPVLRAVATDGHRLARVELDLPEGAAGLPDAIIPRKCVGEVAKLLGESDQDVKVSLSSTRVRFSFGSITLTSKLIDGTFPDYERVIPANNDKRLQVDPKSFRAAVERVATIATEKTRAIKLSLDTNALTLSATAPEAGSASEDLDVAYEQEAMEIGFNSRYLLDITDQITQGDAVFTLASANAPTVISDAEDSSALYVLMPMRV